MRSKTTTSVLQSRPSKTSAGAICAGILFASLMTTVEPASALIPQVHGSLQNQLKQDSSIIEVYVRRGGGARRTTVVGPRGGVASRTVVRRGAVVRPGLSVGGWLGSSGSLLLASGRRDRRRCRDWRCDGGTAAAWAGSPPAPGYVLVLHRSKPDAGVLGRLSVGGSSGVRAMTLLRTDHRPDDRPSEDNRTDDMVWIPGGTFRMGSDNHYPEEAPVHRVTVDGFWIDRTPVTNRQFNAIRDRDRSQDRSPRFHLIRRITPARCRTCSTRARWCSSRRTRPTICATGASGGPS